MTGKYREKSFLTDNNILKYIDIGDKKHSLKHFGVLGVA